MQNHVHIFILCQDMRCASELQIPVFTSLTLVDLITAGIVTD